MSINITINISIKELAENLNKVKNISNNIKDFSKNINKRNKVRNNYMLSGLMFLSIITFILSIKLKSYFLLIASPFIMLVSFIFIFSFLNKKKESDSILVKKICCYYLLNKKEKSTLNDYFDGLSEIEQKILTIGTIENNDFVLSDKNIEDIVVNYLENTDKVEVIENQKYIFMLIDYMDDKDLKDEVIEKYILKTDIKKEEDYSYSRLNELKKITKSNKKQKFNIKEL